MKKLITLIASTLILLSCQSKQEELKDYLSVKYHAEQSENELSFVLNDSYQQLYVKDDITRIVGTDNDVQLLGSFIDNKYVDVYAWSTPEFTVEETLTVDSVNTTIIIKIKDKR